MLLQSATYPQSNSITRRLMRKVVSLYKICLSKYTSKQKTNKLSEVELRAYKFVSVRNSFEGFLRFAVLLNSNAHFQVC